MSNESAKDLQASNPSSSPLNSAIPETSSSTTSQGAPSTASTSSIRSSQPIATGTRHRRTASDIKPTSAAARRMSMSATPQESTGRVGSGYRIGARLRRSAQEGMRRPLLLMAGILSTIVITATTYSSIHSLALNTSLYPTGPRTAYFAQKSNIFNQYFVKLAWLHTSLIYLPHLLTTPSTHLSTYLIPHSISYTLATAFWALFTTWFFGRGIGDRIIELSGGKCVIALPDQWGLDRETVEEMMKLVPTSVGASLLTSNLDSTTSSLAQTANILPPDNNLYLAVPGELCTSHRPLTPKSHPDIFSILSNLPFPQKVYENSERPTLAIPKPRWYRGHDISGHVFILVLSTLLITRRLVPAWRRWLGVEKSDKSSRGSGRSGDQVLRIRIHAGLTLAGSALVFLWLWMTTMTAIYFHNPQEKISGLVLGLTTAYLVEILTPSPSISQIPTSTATRSSPGLDENGARRGDTITDSVGTSIGIEKGDSDAGRDKSE